MEKQEEGMKFYGLDGDKIGSIVESYIITDEIEALSLFSDSVSRVLEEIKADIIARGGSIIFCAGDSILFKGQFDGGWCMSILALFVSATKQTASLGIGDTPTAAYLALKLAKAKGGGIIIQFPPPSLAGQTGQP
ncbi:MAG: hypothetical protein NVS2B12_23760 [Ktedonobacteraceae bacterium]